MANTELHVTTDVMQPARAASEALPYDLTDTRRGWLVVAAAFLGLFLSMGTLVVYSFGVLATAMGEDLGFSSAQLSTMFMIFSLATVLAGPVWGALTDRFGGRSITMISSLLLAGLFCALTALPSGNAAVLYAAYAALGLLASGTLPASYATVVVSWFDKQRGLALGFTMMGIGAGAAILPPLSAALLAHFGWRNTYLIYGFAVALVCVPVLMIFLKPNPSFAREQSASSSLPRLEFIRQAGRVRSTWILTFFALLMGAMLVGSLTSFVPMLQAQGMSRVQATGYQSVLGISLIAGRIIIGGLIDRIFAPRVMMAVLGVTTLGYVSMYYAHSPATYVLSAAGIGLAIGAEMDFLSFLVSRYYTRAAFATMFAFLFSCYALGAAFGPLLVGRLEATFGSYQPGLLMFAGLTFILGLTTLLLPRYDKK